MGKIRVLIADDSALMRTVLRQVLNTEEDIEVVGTASDGEDAIQKAADLQPQVIIMDLNMPGFSGIDATESIMQAADAKPAIIIFSSLTKKDADLVLQCMKKGAFSCVHKPDFAYVPSEEIVCSELLQEIRLAGAHSCATPATIKQAKRSQKSSETVPILVIGASTGGPAVLHELLMSMNTSLNAAVLVVQHMPAGFTKSFALRLNRASELSVKEAENGDILQPNHVYIAPGDYHMAVQKNRKQQVEIILNQAQPVHSLRPAVDATMKSVAELGVPHVVAAILTGMGQDGAEGMQMLHDAGYQTVVQEPSSCVVSGMVDAALKLKAVDHIARIESIPTILSSLVQEHEL